MRCKVAAQGASSAPSNSVPSTNSSSENSAIESIIEGIVNLEMEVERIIHAEEDEGDSTVNRKNIPFFRVHRQASQYCTSISFKQNH